MTAFQARARLASVIVGCWLLNASATAAQVRSDVDETSAAIVDASLRFAIPEALLRAVIAAESRGRSAAVSPKGAIGLMQLMPGTWRDLTLEYGLGRDPFEPRANVMAGAAYLRRMYDRFGLLGALAAYNAGPERYQQFVDQARPLPAETTVYVAQVHARLRGAQPFERVVPAASWRDAPLFPTASSVRFVGPGGDSAPDQPGHWSPQ